MERYRPLFMCMSMSRSVGQTRIIRLDKSKGRRYSRRLAHRMTNSKRKKRFNSLLHSSGYVLIVNASARLFFGAGQNVHEHAAIQFDNKYCVNFPSEAPTKFMLNMNPLLDGHVTFIFSSPQAPQNIKHSRSSPADGTPEISPSFSMAPNRSCRSTTNCPTRKSATGTGAPAHPSRRPRRLNFAIDSATPNRA